MNQNNNIDGILSKIDDMRGFFKIGDEIIPFLGDLFVFLKDVMPLMTEINTSLHDSNRKLPTASDKIASATSTTEMATHEILDKLDNISNALPKIKMGSDEKVKIAQNEIDAIILSLQFQDITAQQLEHANRILDAIHEKFSKLFASIEAVKKNTTAGENIVQALESGSDSEEKKKDAEVFETKTEDKMRHDTEISQDDIDALFG